jgi:hypothetical protein
MTNVLIKREHLNIDIQGEHYVKDGVM